MDLIVPIHFCSSVPKKGEIVVTRQLSQDRHAISDFSVFARHILGHGIQ